MICEGCLRTKYPKTEAIVRRDIYGKTREISEQFK